MHTLEKLLESGQIPHALLLAGRNLEGKAEEFSRSLGAFQTDIHHYRPEGKIDLHPIASIRSLIQDVALVAYEGKWKVFIIHEAEKMLPTSANALLKTLEEPTKHTCILLLTAHPEKLLVTIRSRCQTYTFLQADDQDRTKILDYLSGKGGDLEEENPELIWETWMLWHRDRHLLEIEGGEEYLSFPDHKQSIAQLPLTPLKEIEQKLSQARLAQQRSFKLSLILELLVG